MARQTEAQKRAALLDRVDDVASGVRGCSMEYAVEFLSIYNLQRFFLALRSIFGGDVTDDIFWIDNLEHFASAESAATYLYDVGVRA